MKITIEVENNKQLDKFIELVDSFENINSKKMTMRSLKIRFKYDMKSSGEFWDSRPNSLTINPTRCDKTGEWSFFNILVHEFSHLIDNKFKICPHYVTKFSDKKSKLHLTNYAKRCKDPVEELAEIISLYLRNPYLLKLISMSHYTFISRFFKPTVPCNHDYFLSQYELCSPRYKKTLTKKYGITISGCTILKNGIVFDS